MWSFLLLLLRNNELRELKTFREEILSRNHSTSELYNSPRALLLTPPSAPEHLTPLRLPTPGVVDQGHVDGVDEGSAQLLPDVDHQPKAVIIRGFKTNVLNSRYKVTEMRDGIIS